MLDNTPNLGQGTPENPEQKPEMNQMPDPMPPSVPPVGTPGPEKPVDLVGNPSDDKKKKTLLIAGAVVAILGVVGAAVYFGQGMLFKGSVEETYKLAAPELCPDGMYFDETATNSGVITEPARTASGNLLELGLGVANAQSKEDVVTTFIDEPVQGNTNGYQSRPPTCDPAKGESLNFEQTACVDCTEVIKIYASTTNPLEKSYYAARNKMCVTQGITGGGTTPESGTGTPTGDFPPGGGQTTGTPDTTGTGTGTSTTPKTPVTCPKDSVKVNVGEVKSMDTFLTSLKNVTSDENHVTKAKTVVSLWDELSSLPQDDQGICLDCLWYQKIKNYMITLTDDFVAQYPEHKTLWDAAKADVNGKLTEIKKSLDDAGIACDTTPGTEIPPTRGGSCVRIDYCDPDLVAKLLKDPAKYHLSPKTLELLKTEPRKCERVTQEVECKEGTVQIDRKDPAFNLTTEEKATISAGTAVLKKYESDVKMEALVEIRSYASDTSSKNADQVMSEIQTLTTLNSNVSAARTTTALRTDAVSNLRNVETTQCLNCEELDELYKKFVDLYTQLLDKFEANKSVTSDPAELKKITDAETTIKSYMDRVTKKIDALKKENRCPVEIVQCTNGVDRFPTDGFKTMSDALKPLDQQVRNIVANYDGPNSESSQVIRKDVLIEKNAPESSLNTARIRTDYAAGIQMKICDCDTLALFKERYENELALMEYVLSQLKAQNADAAIIAQAQTAFDKTKAAYETWKATAIKKLNCPERVTEIPVCKDTTYKLTPELSSAGQKLGEKFDSVPTAAEYQKAKTSWDAIGKSEIMKKYTTGESTKTGMNALCLNCESLKELEAYLNAQLDKVKSELPANDTVISPALADFKSELQKFFTQAKRDLKCTTTTTVVERVPERTPLDTCTDIKQQVVNKLNGPLGSTRDEIKSFTDLVTSYFENDCDKLVRCEEKVAKVDYYQKLAEAVDQTTWDSATKTAVKSALTSLANNAKRDYENTCMFKCPVDMKETPAEPPSDKPFIDETGMKSLATDTIAFVPGILSAHAAVDPTDLFNLTTKPTEVGIPAAVDPASCPTPEPPKVTCVALPTEANLGQDVKFEANVTNYTGTDLTYTWTNTGSVNSGKSITTKFDKTGFQASGVKVTKTDGTVVGEARCPVTIKPPVLTCNPPDAVQVGQSSNFTTTLTGLSQDQMTDVKYVWSGDVTPEQAEANKTKSNLNLTYTTSGSKTVKVSAVRDGYWQSNEALCSTRITDTPPRRGENPSLSLSCIGTPGSVKAGEAITWKATLTGTDPQNVPFTWSGSENLSVTGNGKTSVTKIYNQTNSQAQATVKVVVNNVTLQVTCNNVVIEEPTDREIPPGETDDDTPPRSGGNDDGTSTLTQNIPGDNDDDTPPRRTEVTNNNPPRETSSNNPGGDTETKTGIFGDSDSTGSTTVRPAAPEGDITKTPEITPTGPEMIIYLFGAAGSQAIVFRKKIVKKLLKK